MESKKQVIVVSLPGESNVQYFDNIQNLADFAIEMDAKTEGRDHLFIIHDRSGRKYLQHHTFTNAHLIEVDEPGLDMWMRDFPPCMPNQQIKFRYRPQYINASQAKLDESNFWKFAGLVGLPQLQQSDLVLEGGNIVENGADAAITTERVFEDNPNVTEHEFVKELEATIKRKVAVVEDPQDTTGHADGILSFVEEDVLLISLFDDADGPRYYESMKSSVLKVFPDLTIIPLPCYIKKYVSHGFASAEGSYANSLVTNNAVYVPFFSNQTANERAFAVFQSSTDKDVVAVEAAGKVPGLGGSLRCMSWQIDQEHPVAKALFAYVNNKQN
ncbi:putative agmatine deiminase [Oculina patagonica]